MRLSALLAGVAAHLAVTVDGTELYPVHLSYTQAAIGGEWHCHVQGVASWWAATQQDATDKAVAAAAGWLGVEPDQILPLVA